ncbi:energy transducer TonB, partial [Xanthomonas cannabis pv. phaseoli]
MLDLTQGRMARRIAPVILLVGLAACSKQEDKAATTAPATGATPAAPAAAATPATAVSPQVQSMAADQLRASATKALQDNRMYAPAGDNAVEYYLALREKQPQDATVNSALTDLLPYTLIAAEQGISREEFPEAQRLIALIEKVDPKAPALPRLKSGLDTAMKTAANRSEQDAEQAKKLVEDKAEQAAEQKRLAEQQTREAAAAQQIAAQQEAARQQTADAERQAAARRQAEAPAPAPAAPRPAPAAAAAAAPAAQSLRPI